MLTVLERRKNGETFLLNWCCHAVYGERPKPIDHIAEQEDVTEFETVRLRHRLMADPGDPEALQFQDDMIFPEFGQAVGRFDLRQAVCAKGDRPLRGHLPLRPVMPIHLPADSRAEQHAHR